MSGIEIFFFKSVSNVHVPSFSLPTCGIAVDDNLCMPYPCISYLQPLDYEKKKSYSVDIKVTDDGRVNYNLTNFTTVAPASAVYTCVVDVEGMLFACVYLCRTVSCIVNTLWIEGNEHESIDLCLSEVSIT